MEVIGIILIGLFLIFAVLSGISAQSTNNDYRTILNDFNDIESLLDLELENERKYGDVIDYSKMLKTLEKELSETLERKKSAYNNRFNNKHYHSESIKGKQSINATLKVAELKCLVLERDILKIKNII